MYVSMLCERLVGIVLFVDVPYYDCVRLKTGHLSWCQFTNNTLHMYTRSFLYCAVVGV